MLTNEPGGQVVSDAIRAGILPDERERFGRPSIESLLAEGCRQETNGSVTRIIGSGEGFTVRETVLRPRFRQGV